MGQWGRFSQIKHEAYPEPLSCTVSVSVRCLCAGREQGKSDLMLLNGSDYVVDTIKGNSVKFIVQLRQHAESY